MNVTVQNVHALIAPPAYPRRTTLRTPAESGILPSKLTSVASHDAAIAHRKASVHILGDFGCCGVKAFHISGMLSGSLMNPTSGLSRKD